MKNFIKRLFSIKSPKQVIDISEGSYQEIEGDLLAMFISNKFDTIAHVTNCYKNMSGGIALQIARRWPEVEQADNNFCYDYDGADRKLMLGQIIPVGVNIWTYKKHKGQMERFQSINKNIVNLYAQYKPGYQVNYDYESLRKCLRTLNDMSRRIKKTNIGMPMIGAGIGGADWHTVHRIIEETMVDCQVTIVIWK